MPVPRSGVGDDSRFTRDRQPPVVSPPITCSTVPVMYDESAFEARKTYAGASSSGCAARFIGLSAPNLPAFSAVSPLSDGLSGVHTGPGATALTRIPRSSRSIASDFVKALTAPFVAE